NLKIQDFIGIVLLPPLGKRVIQQVLGWGTLDDKRQVPELGWHIRSFHAFKLIVVINIRLLRVALG
ncbi:MAG: hypothetical protein WAV05_08345, partial [Anaerolineales bacterium]